MAHREVVGVNYSGRPVFSPTDEELRAMSASDYEEEFDEVLVLEDGREVAITGYDDATKTYRYHEVDDRGEILPDKPVDPKDV